jgi:hypothetical protein
MTPAFFIVSFYIIPYWNYWNNNNSFSLITLSLYNDFKPELDA